MLKNLLLLGVLSWVSFSYANGPQVAKENFSDSENFKLEKPVEEQDAKRGVAGDKIKKKKKHSDVGHNKEKSIESDSDVRYWQYSE